MTTTNDNTACCELGHNHALKAVIDKMPNIDTLFNLAEFFKVFGDSTRIRIMCALFQGDLCVCEIAEIVGMEQSAVSHQLRILRSANIVKSRREGKSSIYSLDDDHIREIYQTGLTHIEEE